MTELLYLPDADDVTTFTATVTAATPEYVVLDGTHFYPGGGGQPADRGVLEWDGGRATVVDARKDHGDVRHEIELDGEPPAPGTTVEGRIDEERRERLTRLHTAQHVVSRVGLEEYGAATVGSQIYPDRAYVDFDPAGFDADDVETIQQRTNEVLASDLEVRKAERPRERVEQRVDERRAFLDAIPDAVDPLRVVEIEGFDICPCGGTHVDSLGEVGAVEITDRTAREGGVERLTFELQ